MLRKILGTQPITGFVGGKKGRTVKQQVMPETTIQLLNSFRSTDMLNLHTASEDIQELSL